MKKLWNKKSITLILVVCLIVVGALILNGLTGEDVVAGSEDFTVQSTLEMEETNINSQTGGQVQKLNIKEGDSVVQGQVIVIINSDTLNTQRQQAEASITTIQGQILSAETSRDLAKVNFDRMSQLYDAGAISQSAYDSAKAQYDVANAAIVTLQGQKQTALAAIAEVDTYLSKMEITAPTDGIVTEVNVEVGELISSGLPIAVITDTSEPWVLCNVMEKDLSKVELGQSVEVSFQAYPGKVFSGKVKEINKSADFAVKRATNSNGEFDVLAYGVKVELLDVDETLYAGMTVSVNFVDNGEN